MMIKVLHNNSCSKSRVILEYLDENGVAFEVIDFISNPLTEEELRALLKKLNMPAADLIRRSDALFKELNLTEPLDEAKSIEILLAHPSLLHRPIIVQGQIAMVARPVEVAQLFIEK